jgi:hypothetical protein
MDGSLVIYRTSIPSRFVRLYSSQKMTSTLIIRRTRSRLSFVSPTTSQHFTSRRNPYWHSGLFLVSSRSPEVSLPALDGLRAFSVTLTEAGGHIYPVIYCRIHRDLREQQWHERRNPLDRYELDVRDKCRPIYINECRIRKRSQCCEGY